MTDPEEHTPDAGGEADELSLEELEAEGGTELPDREAMSLISANVDIPASPEIAADVLAGDLEGVEDGGDPPPPDEA